MIQKHDFMCINVHFMLTKSVFHVQQITTFDIQVLHVATKIIATEAFNELSTKIELFIST